MKPNVNPTTHAVRRYYFELGASMIAYVGVIFLSRTLWQHSAGHWRTMAALLPLIPAAVAFASIVRLILRIDEFQRRLQIESLALAGGVTALLAVTYGLLEGEGGLPAPSAWWTYTVFMVSWVIARLFIQRRYQ